MKEQIYVGETKAAMEATVSIAEGVLWRSVSVPIRLHCALISRRAGEDGAREARRRLWTGTPATSDKTNVRIRGQFQLLLLDVLQSLPVIRLPC